MSEFLEQLKNKITYYIHKQVNDDEANQYAEKKKQEQVEQVAQEQAIQEQTKQEEYDNAPPDATGSGVSIKRVVTQTVDACISLIKKYFFLVLAFILGSFIANELIMYPAMMRGIMFLFTVFICYTNTFIGIGVTLYYIGKNLYERYGVNADLYDAYDELLTKYSKVTETYQQKVENDPSYKEKHPAPTPPTEPINDPAFIRLMPKIFAFVPLFVKDLNKKDGFFYFITKYFTYLKDEPTNPNKETPLQTLTTIMKKYNTALTLSFPYYESVKGDPIFVQRMKECTTHMEKMHAQKPKEKEEKEENTLPPTIDTPNAPSAPSAPTENKILYKPNGTPNRTQAEQYAQFNKEDAEKKMKEDRYVDAYAAYVEQMKTRPKPTTPEERARNEEIDKQFVEYRGKMFKNFNVPNNVNDTDVFMRYRNSLEKEYNSTHPTLFPPQAAPTERNLYIEKETKRVEEAMTKQGEKLDAANIEKIKDVAGKKYDKQSSA